MTDTLTDRSLGRGVAATDRPGQAAQNLFTGNLPGVWRSLFQPTELSPLERDSLLKKWGLAEGPYAQVFKTITNPVLLLALAVSHRFPIPMGENVFKLSKRVQGLAAKIPILRSLSSMQGLFQGVKRAGSKVDFVDEFGGIIRDTNDFRSKYGSSFALSLQKFQRGTGHFPDRKEQTMVSAWLDGLHKPLRGFQGKKGTIRLGSGETTTTLPGVGILVPNLEAHMPQSLLQLAKDFRITLNDQFTEVFTDIKGRKRILKAIARQKKAGFGDDITDTMHAFLADPKRVPDYFPRRLVQNEEDFRKLISMMTESSSGRKFTKAAVAKTQAWASPEVYKRQFQMTPDAGDLALLGDLVDKGSLAKLQAVSKAKIIHSARLAGVRTSTLKTLKTLPLNEIEEKFSTMFQRGEARILADVLHEVRPKQYSLKLMPVISQYNHTLAGTFAWTVKGGGEKVVDMLDDLKFRGRGDAVARYQADILESTYIPTAMGRGTFRNAIRAQMHSQASQQLGIFVKESPLVTKLLGKKLTGEIAAGLEASKGAFSFMNLQRKTAGYFYLSTLGLNPGSALKNLLQLVLTTGPVIGFRTTAAGASEAMRKSHKYFALRLGPRGLSHEQALRDAYPLFSKAGLVASPITEEAIQNTLQNAYEIAKLPSGVAKTSEKIQRGMMAMFTASETANRLITFEAGMIHATRAKAPVDAAIEFSRRLVEKTQFLTGVQNTPFLLVDKSPIIRQLTQFPLKMLEFATTTALSLGSGAIDPRTGKEMNLLGFNPGTFARMIAGSVIAMELGDAMGVNLGDALLGGALPTFQPAGKVLAPIPIVPPFFQITGAAAIGLGSGDFTELARSTPLLVPGGVAAFRAMGLLPPGVPGSQVGQRASKIFGRTFADYNEPAPDGRIAVYSGKGTLRGFFRPWELVRYGLGVKGGDLDTEQALLNELVTQRDTIRSEKAAYMEARFTNNAAKANSISTNFKQRFGFDIPVSEKDMKGMQLRRQITRLEQVIRTLPPGQARDQMTQVIAGTLGASGDALLGIDPSLLGAGSQTREKARASRGSGRPGFSAKTGLSPFDQVNPSTIGRQQGVNRQQPPF